MRLFNKLFGTNTDDQHSFEIDFTKSGIIINNDTIRLPVDLSVLNELLGIAEIIKTEHNSIYIWQNSGIRGFSKDEQHVFELEIQILKMDHNQFFPRKSYSGVIRIENMDYKEFVKITKDDYLFKDYLIGDLELSVRLTKEEPKQIRSISIGNSETDEIPSNPNKDKYKQKTSIQDKIEFTDFNFKLAIIEELMYNKGLLKPKFDLFEFIALYQERRIDTDEEGYGLIPEVVAYFENLEIDKKFAEQITEIYQDGGNQIYMNIIPYWDGEDGIFDIQSFEDLGYFPNLKKMTLFSTDPKVFKVLKARGIDAKHL